MKLLEKFCKKRRRNQFQYSEQPSEKETHFRNATFPLKMFGFKFRIHCLGLFFFLTFFPNSSLSQFFLFREANEAKENCLYLNLWLSEEFRDPYTFGRSLMQLLGLASGIYQEKKKRNKLVFNLQGIQLEKYFKWIFFIFKIC